MKPGPAPLLTLDEALARLLGAVAPLPATTHETVSTFDALGRVLQQDVRSALDVPPQDNTSMDGYAMRVADVHELVYGFSAISAAGIITFAIGELMSPKRWMRKMNEA